MLSHFGNTPDNRLTLSFNEDDDIFAGAISQPDIVEVELVDDSCVDPIEVTDKLQELLEVMTLASCEAEGPCVPFARQHSMLLELPELEIDNEVVTDILFPNVPGEFFTTKYGDNLTYLQLEGNKVVTTNGSNMSFASPIDLEDTEGVIFVLCTYTRRVSYLWSDRSLTKSTIREPCYLRKHGMFFF